MRLLLLPVLLALAAAVLLLVAADDGPTAGGVRPVQETAATGLGVQVPVATPRTYQGKPARWWAARAVQARKDANARGRTIRRLQAAQRRASAHFFDWVAAADCVRSHEGAWDDAGAPYWGGMQMDLSFQRTYGADHFRHWGTADNWPWWAQLEAAYRGWLFRGWNPWPATSARCGLR